MCYLNGISWTSNKKLLSDFPTKAKTRQSNKVLIILVRQSGVVLLGISQQTQVARVSPWRVKMKFFNEGKNVFHREQARESIKNDLTKLIWPSILLNTFQYFTQPAETRLSKRKIYHKFVLSTTLFLIRALFYSPLIFGAQNKFKEAAASLIMRV